MYPRAVRANASNWGEESGYSRAGTWIPHAAEHVSTHEVGHLFSWPDEYWEYGGACHKQYITGQDIDFAKEPPLIGTDTWQLSARANLMGGGVYIPITGTPIYYVHRIRDWFRDRTNKPWKVIK